MVVQQVAVTTEAVSYSTVDGPVSVMTAGRVSAVRLPWKRSVVAILMKTMVHVITDFIPCSISFSIDSMRVT